MTVDWELNDWLTRRAFWCFLRLYVNCICVALHLFRRRRLRYPASTPVTIPHANVRYILCTWLLLHHSLRAFVFSLFARVLFCRCASKENCAFVAFFSDRRC